MKIKALLLCVGCAAAAGQIFAAPAKPASVSTPPLRQSVLGWQTWPSSGERTFPDSPLPADRTNAVVDVVSAKGAAATATFAIRSSAAISSLTLKVADIPLSDIDLRTVKCWYQNANGWFSAWKAPGNAVLVPELLLHDDSLVKTDPQTKSNLLRTSAEGAAAEYVTVDPLKPAASDFTVADDSATLKPFALAAGETREFFLTIPVPADAAAGLFRGKIEVSDADKSLGHFTLNLRVIDFTLPEGTSRFLGSKYLDGTKTISGASPAPVKADSPEPFLAAADLPDAMLTKANCRILRDAQLSPVIPVARLASAADLDFGKTSIWIADNFTDAKAADKLLSEITANTETARKLGFADILYYIPSDYDADTYRKLLDAADTAGARTLTFADDTTFGLAADLITAPMQRGLVPENNIRKRPLMGDPYGNTEYTDTRQVERWHSLGTPNYLFVTLDAGIENPAIWRRKLGMECYYLGFEGFILPSLAEEKSPWTDSASDLMRSRTFLYPTKSGAIRTLAFEAIGEAVTDVRYLSAVTRLADAARYVEGDIKVGIEGRKASSWLDWIHPKTENIEATRLNAIAWIDRLDTILKKVGK